MVPTAGRGVLPRRVLGASGLEVSAVGIGCWAIGGPATNLGLPMGWSTATDEGALAGLARAVELGVNLFDTADVYGHGHSERLLGRFLRERSVPREQVVIASKVGYAATGGVPSAYQPAHLRRRLEQTLTNLGTDYLDIYFLHNFDFGEDDAFLPGAIDQMHAFRAQGLIRAVGMRGPHRLATERLRTAPHARADKHARFRAVAEQVRPQVLAVRCNLLSPDPPDGPLAWAVQHGVGLLLNKPLAQGLLTGKYDPDRPPVFGHGDHRSRKRWFTPPALAIIRDGLAPLQDRFGARPADLVRVALGYCLQHPHADRAAVLAGFTTPTQVQTNLTCLGEPLSTKEWQLLRAAGARLRARLDDHGEVFVDEAPR